MYRNHSEETQRSNSTRIDLFIECKESSELNWNIELKQRAWNIELKQRAWNIELKLRATATTPRQGIYRKGNEDQIQYATINSLNVMTHLN
jgi:hypothetical protein